jgi:predicted patatin/cPLA2 family phospholipase
MSRRISLGAIVAVLLILAAGVVYVWSTRPIRRPAVPLEFVTTADVIGLPDGIRYYYRDRDSVDKFEEELVESWNRERAEIARHGAYPNQLPPAYYLAISGGGDNGAFGAGFLNGWTKHGNRPEFKIVTGVSTGALIAPFAFLGSDYDPQLRAIYTGVSMKDIAAPRWPLLALFRDAMSDTSPLYHLMERTITQDILDKIGAEYDKGRILLVGTTNLDARRPVYWDITRIAASRAPGALTTVRKILMASAAIPGTFPPVMIDVKAGGKRYQEMHVDGGTANQVFTYPVATTLSDLSRRNLASRDRTLYIIRNARLDPDWAQVDRRTLPIAMRAIQCLIQYQGIGDLYRIFTITRRDHVDFNLAYIPETFRLVKKRDFDPTYMRTLYDLAFGMASDGYSWAKHPPILFTGEGDPMMAKSGQAFGDPAEQ